MRALRVLGWIMVVLALGACTKNEVKLTFSLPADVTSAVRLAYYASGANGGMMRETAVEVREGKGEAVLPERYPSLLYLFSPSDRQPAAVAYIERGDKLTVSGADADVFSWEIKGSEINEALTQWRLDNLELIRRRDKEGLDKAVAAYVEKYPDSPAAAIILYLYYDRRDKGKEFSALQGKLGDKLLENKDLMSALSEADLMAGLPLEASVPQQIILMGEDKFADTLQLRGGSGKLLIFQASVQPGKDALEMDSLRKWIAAKGKDVAVEIFTDSDSVAWERHLRKDTIPGLRRMWMPLGTADSLAISLGVRRIPYFILLDSKGRETYRGSDWNAVSGRNH